MKALCDVLEIWGLEEGKVIFSDGSLGFALELCPLDVTTWDDPRIDRFAGQLTNFLNGLPTGIDIQFVHDIGKGFFDVMEKSNALAQKAVDQTVRSLHEERVKRLREACDSGLLPKQTLRLFVRRPMPKALFERPKLFSRPKLFEPLAAETLRREMNALNHLENDITAKLLSLGLKPRMIPDAELAELVYRQWNPMRKDALQRYDADDIRSSLLFSDVGITEGGFSICAMHYRVISLKLLPELTYASMARTLENLPFDSRLFLSVHLPDQHKELESLQMQRRLAFSMARGKRNGVSDIESEAKLQDIETLLSDLVAQGEKVFWVSLNVVLKSDDEDQLTEQVSQTLTTIRELSGAEAMEESLACFDIFSQISVPNARCTERVKRMKTSNLADLLPVFGPFLGCEVPRILLRSRQGGLVSLDPFAKEFSNSNQVVAGGSGSGKSFLANLLLLQALKENPTVFIIDIGGSYKKLSDNLSGQYVPLSLNSSLSINPFDLPSGQTTPENQKIKFLVGLIEMMTREEGEQRIGRLERAEIEEEIQKVYVKQKTPCLSDLRAVLLEHKEEGIRRFGKILSPWCGNSPFGQMIDRPTTISLEKRIVCFDLKGLEAQPDLQAVCLYLITDFVWREVQKDRHTIKFIVFDECWKLLENEAGAAFIGEAFRTFRKYFASAIAISQNIDDFAKSKVAEAILPNTAIKWILMQRGADQGRLKEVLDLNDTEISLISSLCQRRGEYSEAFLMAQDEHAVVQIEPTPLEYWIATTDPRDLSEFQKRVEEGTKSQLEILKELATKFPKGVSRKETE
ncbi:MAG: ATP-binding protein [Deltaproteobacteria bacterium]|nr:ATP-binding protein [Deltaproteobacteria bacterium]